MNNKLIINAGLFQLTWFLLVLNVYGGYAGLVSLLSMLAYSIVIEKYQKQHLLMSISVVIMGVIMDTLLSVFGILSFSDDTFIFIPLWLIGLWCAFSLTLNSSLRWLLEKPVIFIISMTIFGPMSYYFGSKISSLILSEYAIFYFPLFWFLISILIFNLYISFFKSKIYG